MLKRKDLYYEFNPAWIVEESSELVVINKPSGLLTHATADKSRKNLVDLLRQARPDFKGLTLQHRLDLGTSGLVIFTIGESLRASVAKKFAQGEIKKEYLCWVRGKKLAKKWTIEVPLGERSGRVYIGEGKSARTDFLLLKRDGPYCLLKALPLTGRKHQIRAHLAHAKLPILGDVLFGGDNSHRLLLHASGLGFSLDGRRDFKWTAAVDQDFLPSIGKA